MPGTIVFIRHHQQEQHYCKVEALVLIETVGMPTHFGSGSWSVPGPQLLMFWPHPPNTFRAVVVPWPLHLVEDAAYEAGPLIHFNVHPALEVLSSISRTLSNRNRKHRLTCHCIDGISVE